MSAELRAYQPECDFFRIRDFLADTYAAFEAPVNWGIERWNYARYFIAPMLGSYGTERDTPEGALQAIRLGKTSWVSGRMRGRLLASRRLSTLQHGTPGSARSSSSVIRSIFICSMTCWRTVSDAAPIHGRTRCTSSCMRMTCHSWRP